MNSKCKLSFNLLLFPLEKMDKSNGCPVQENALGNIFPNSNCSNDLNALTTVLIPSRMDQILFMRFLCCSYLLSQTLLYASFARVLLFSIKSPPTLSHNLIHCKETSFILGVFDGCFLHFPDLIKEKETLRNSVFSRGVNTLLVHSYWFLRVPSFLFIYYLSVIYMLPLIFMHIIKLLKR